ncbi:hypothetical protein M1534_01640, partial [Patescibacteria group bacterium]|nr:hypothetical protein [Patescibacteria group bacterium]
MPTRFTRRGGIYTAVLVLSLILIMGAVFFRVAYAQWSEPTAPPTGNNTNPPLDTSSTSQNKTGALTVGSTTNYTAVGMYAPIYYDANNTSYYLQPSNTGTSAVFAGDVLIGGTSPVAPLAVDYNANNSSQPYLDSSAGLIINNSYSTGNGILKLENSVSPYHEYIVYGGGDTTDELTLMPRYYSSGQSSVVNADAYGNLGVVGSNPLISVNSSAAGGTDLELYTTGNGGVLLSNTAGKNLWLGTVGSDSIIFGTDNGIYQSAFSGTGELGVGTIAPQGNLDVYGNAPDVLVDGSTDSTYDVARLQLQSATTGYDWRIAYRGTSAGGDYGALAFMNDQGTNNYYPVTFYATAPAYFGNGIKFGDGSVQTTAAGGGNLWAANGSNISNTNSGNVGIGTTAPSGLLTINTSAQTTNLLNIIAHTSGTPTTEFLHATNASGSDVPTVGFDLENSAVNMFEIFGSSGGSSYASRLGINLNNGNVGIGVGNPADKLTIAGTSYPTTFTGIGSTVGITGSIPTNGFAKLTFGNGAGGDYGGIGLLPTNSGSYLYFGTSNNYASGITNNAMVIDYNGNVGIGTTSPFWKFNVQGGNIGLGVPYGSSDTSNYEMDIATMSPGVPYFSLQQGGSAASRFYQSGGELHVQNFTGGTSGNDLMVWNDSTGAVGIGNTPMNYQLNVGAGALGTTSSNTANILSLYNTNSNANYLNFLQIRNANGTDWNTATTRIQEVTDVTNQGYIDFNPPGGQYDLAFGTGTHGEIMRLLSNGNVGIGTASPDQLLTVSGIIHSTSGGFEFPDGTVLTSALPTTSCTNISGGNSGALASGGSYSVTSVSIATSSTKTLISTFSDADWYYNGSNFAYYITYLCGASGGCVV